MASQDYDAKLVALVLLLQDGLSLLSHV